MKEKGKKSVFNAPGTSLQEKKKIISVGSFCFQFKSSPVAHDEYLSILVFCSINRLEKNPPNRIMWESQLSAALTMQAVLYR